MPARVKVKCAYQLTRIKTPGMHAVGRVAGLYLDWRSELSMSWILRASLRGKRCDFGLGSYPEISLEVAREKATEWRKVIRDGIDPRERQRQRVAENTAQAEKRLTFEQAAEKCWKAKKHLFDNARHTESWITSVRTYANPILGKMYVEDIQRAHVLTVLEPLWTTITDTASKLRGRIETIISYSYALNNITDRKNPAEWVDGLDALLPSAKTLRRKAGKHYPALPWTRVSVLVERLASKPTMGARALEWQIATTSRGIEVRGARWPEIDWVKKEWTVPGKRMKNKRPHRVPLTDAQLEWLRALPRMEDCDLIFPSSKKTMISDATIGKVIKDLNEADIKAAKLAGMTDEQIDREIKACRLGFVDPEQDHRIATPHGTARSSFKDWVRNNVAHRFGDEVSELCIAHVNSDATRAAYARDELIDLRRLMLAEYIDFIYTPIVERPRESANSPMMSMKHLAA
jgi:integrase